MCRETINITKRILLRGSGQLGDTKLDQRANCPTFRLGRSAVIMHVELDMTGFREAILITGTDRVCPVLQDCSIRYLLAMHWLKHNMPMYPSDSKQDQIGCWEYMLLPVIGRAQRPCTCLYSVGCMGARAHVAACTSDECM